MNLAALQRNVINIHPGLAILAMPEDTAWTSLLKLLGQLRNVEYSILLVMGELSTVRCDHALGL